MTKGISVSFGDQYHIIPGGGYCSWIASIRWRNLELSRGQQTVLDLMLAGFCLLFTIGCATQTELTALKSQLRISGDAIVAKQDESIGILRENTNTLAAIKSQVDILKASQAESETGNRIGGDLSSDPPPHVEAVANESLGSSPGSQPAEASAVELLSPVRQWYLVSESWCTNCPKAKARFLAKGWPAANVLTIDQCKARFGFRVPYVPYEFGEPVAVARTAAMSHSEMKALHDQLHGGGSWTWPGDLATHLATKHGVTTGGQQPVSGSFFPDNRASAITSQRSVIRSFPQRKGFFGWARDTSRSVCPTCPR